MGIIEGIDPLRLDQSGWGIIFAHDADPAIKEALSELIELRQNQADQLTKHFRFFEGDDGYQLGESKNRYLARHGAGPGPADPAKVPYYLLIVGSPEKIPYTFQQQLNVQYAVGRIHFKNLDDYARYAASVVAAETGQVKLAREAAIFAPANPDDRPSHLLASQLAQPLVKQLSEVGEQWQITPYLGTQASKGQLDRLLGGEQTPALLFAAAHGLTFANGAARLLQHQGAILCQDWPGPLEGLKGIPSDFYFSGDDLGEEANLSGLIAWLHAGYSAGTPQLDTFARQAFRDRTEMAPRAFLAQLPLRMLACPRGGALAVIGMVDQTWGYSYLSSDANRQSNVFESVLSRLMSGYTVGYAVEQISDNYAELATILSDELDEIEFGKMYDPYELAGLWTAINDWRGFLILGDPAVRLPLVELGEKPPPRPVLKVTSLPSEKVELPGDDAVSFAV